MSFIRRPSPEDIDAIVRRDYPTDEVEEVLSILSNVRDCSNDWEQDWIKLAALACAKGRKGLLQQWIDMGNADSRDLKLAVNAQLGWCWEDNLIRGCNA
jgi:hypothetical protein